MKKNMNEKIRFVISLAVCILFITTAFSVSTGEIFGRANDKTELSMPVSSGTSSHIRIDTSDVRKVASKLKFDGFDVLRGTVTETSLELIVTSGELTMLKGQGYEPVTLEKGRPFREIQAERVAGFVQPPPGYPNLSEVLSEMNTTAANYPSICQMVDLTTTYNASPTYEGRHIYAVKISDNVSQDEDEPTFLMVSCHHVREIVTTVIALYAIEQFTTEYGSDPQITALVDEYEIWISPVWNPDGYEYVFNVNNMWRKNRRYFPEYGTYGVDLNRNYPFGWYGGCSGSTNPSSDTYKGPSPASEAETQTMITFSNDRHFAKVLDYHSYGREVLWSYHPSCHNHPFDSFLQSEAIQLSTAAGYGDVRTASAEGEEYQWQLWTNGTYANLMETHTQFQPSYASAQAEAALVWPGTLWMLERPISLSGNVRDSITEEPLVATINFTGINFPNGEEFKSEDSFGRYHAFLPADSYTVEFSAPDYYSQSHNITVTSTSAEILDIDLVRINDPPETPTIDGPTSGIAGAEVEFSLVTTDPDEDDVYYWVDWGDGTNSDWLGPYQSGTTVNASHIWTVGGDYEIKVKAKDIYLDESGWSEPLTIHIIGSIVEIEKIAGGFGVSAVIKNVGDVEATSVDWSISLEGGLILLGKNKTGTIPSLVPGASETVKSLVFGFGKPTITVSVVCAEGSSDEKTTSGLVILFFVLGAS
ncbi:MAG: hypothetical protein KAV40_04700 [Thermoplasmatales archaeon]|nr:hypothetical protein [Thermoplasmatales archaeon]